jgi:hypothetical protein
MLSAAAAEIVCALQPVSCSIGTISTPGVARIPATTISTRNVVAATTHA